MRRYRTGNNLLGTAFLRVHGLLYREEGQDLVEYALAVAVIALAVTAGMQSIASGLNDVFTTIGSTISSATT
ncbi:Flp family type IVb pilin [Acidicapsa acidisoli]|uniref:Flp family type IVb pilin n=1 Tax=Acidicapsa acidisoli TaxID=1615681 RepID=UPI0021DFE278|nr:Flp family type IVb pilin [Acidicapsa acidisoli]